MEPDLSRFIYELAISAVPSDAALVMELSAELGARLASEPVWEGHATLGTMRLPGALVADQSRVAVVLHQRLWQHDAATSADVATLRQRVRERPESVCVILLDETPVPSWLATAKTVDLATDGLATAVTFALDAIASCGGTVGFPRVQPDAVASPAPWRDGPSPFIAQPRAQSALRHELDAIAEALKSHLDDRRARQTDGVFELHVLPFRMIARLGDRGISFSWVAGRGSTVADGRLLVIEWTGVATEKRGVTALKSASAVREYSYRVEGRGPDDWRWRVDNPNGRAYSTTNLLAEWLGGAAIGSIAGSPDADYLEA